MSLPMTSLTRLVLALVFLLLMTAACSDDDVVAPGSGAAVIAADPLDNVLKTTDGYTPADPDQCCTRLAEVLGLDADQLAALREAYAAFREGVADLRALFLSGDLTLDEARAAALVLRQEFEAEVQLILTAEQWDLLQDMRHDGRRHHERGRHHRNCVELWTSLLEEIGADDDQITAVLQALHILREGIQDLRAQVLDGTLTHEEACAAAQVLRANFDSALQLILTEEQYLALLDLRPDCEGPRHR